MIQPRVHREEISVRTLWLVLLAVGDLERCSSGNQVGVCKNGVDIASGQLEVTRKRIFHMYHSVMSASPIPSLSKLGVSGWGCERLGALNNVNICCYTQAREEACGLDSLALETNGRPPPSLLSAISAETLAGERYRFVFIYYRY